MNTPPSWFVEADFPYANAFSMQVDALEVRLVFAQQVPGDRQVNIRGVTLALSRARELHTMLGQMLAGQEAVMTNKGRKFDA